MQATIRYIAIHNGSTGTLSYYMIDTDRAGAVVSAAATSDEFAGALTTLRDSTAAFNNETQVRMKAVPDDQDELRSAVRSAVAASTEVRQLNSRYWQVRSTAELADFDQRTARLGATMASLPANGNEMIPAQKKLGVIIGLRTSLATALRARDDAGIEAAHKTIHTTSIEFAQIIRDLRTLASADVRLGDTIDQGSSAITRSASLNTDLKQRGVNTTGPEQIVAIGRTQIRLVQDQIHGGNLTGVQSELPEVRETLQTLRDSYRDLLAAEDLPRDTAHDIVSVARTLDVTATRLGAF
jgi:hypothetical protein